MKTIIIAKCVNCGEKRKIKAGEIAKDEVPMCPKCFMPMVAKKAEIKT